MMKLTQFKGSVQKRQFLTPWLCQFLSNNLDFKLALIR